MGLLSSLLGIFGFGSGLLFGLLIGFFCFVYPQSEDVKEVETKTISEVDDEVMLEDIISEIPLWVKSPDYERVDWLNKFILSMWPFLDKAICKTIRTTTEPMFADYIGKCKIESIEFKTLSLGNLPPTIHGLKIMETNERELVMEPAMKWAGNPNIIVVVTIASMKIKIQLVDLQVFASPRITLKPLVPTIPCFANIVVSLMDKPHIDFGINILGADVMSIPGLYRYVQERIKKEVASLYLWPKCLEVPVLDASAVAVKKPVGILHVKVLRATKLLKMDLLGLSDPYVKLSLSGEKLPSKKTTVKKKTLNPEWNEDFKLSVKEPQSQMLLIDVFDWDKVGTHDRLGSQIYPVKLLTSNEPKEVALELLKDTSKAIDPHDKKRHRGVITLEVKYAPFREDRNESFSGAVLPEGYNRKSSVLDRASSNVAVDPSGAGLLLVTVQGAHDVEGSHHSNPYAVVIFRGETKKSKMVKKTRNPLWNEEFQFLLEEPPLNDKIHIEVMSKRTSLSIYSKESLGHVDIQLGDVVHNGRINQKYHLIDSKNGVVHVELKWKSI